MGRYVIGGVEQIGGIVGNDDHQWLELRRDRVHGQCQFFRGKRAVILEIPAVNDPVHELLVLVADRARRRNEREPSRIVGGCTQAHVIALAAAEEISLSETQPVRPSSSRYLRFQQIMKTVGFCEKRTVDTPNGRRTLSLGV